MTSYETVKTEVRSHELGIMGGGPVQFHNIIAHRRTGTAVQREPYAHGRTSKGDISMNTRNEIKAIMVREGMTMTEVVEKMADQYGWSPSVPNLSGKLRRGSLRYQEAVELADALGYDIVWQRRKERR